MNLITVTVTLYATYSETQVAHCLWYIVNFKERFARIIQLSLSNYSFSHPTHQRINKPYRDSQVEYQS